MDNRTNGFESVEERLSRMEAVLNELRELLVSREAVKDFYSTHDVAKILKRRPFTVREWCRLGRINAEKAKCGRGDDPEWRISRAELLRIQNEGLLPIHHWN